MNVAGSERRGAPRYVEALREHWPFIVGTIALVVAATVVYSLAAEERYRAQADILVAPVSEDDETFIGIPVLRESGEARSVLTVARLLRSPQIADAVRQRLRLQIDREELLENVDVKPQEQSNVLTIEAEAGSARGAARLANAFADTLVARRTAAFQGDVNRVIGRLSTRLEQVARGSPEREALSTRLGELRALVGEPDPTIRLFSRAVAPREPSWPRPVLSLVVALVAGVLLGMGVAVMLELVNPLVLREEDLAEFGAPVLARVPRVSGAFVRSEMVGRGRVPEGIAEPYRILRANLRTARPDHGAPSSVLVTSAAHGEGTSTTATNLAVILALAGVRAVLVDCNVRNPTVADILDVRDPAHGLASVLAGERSVDEALVPAPRLGERLQLLLPERGDPALVDLLEPERVRSLLSDVAGQGDVAVFDVPPLTEVADGLALADAVDAVLVVVRLGRTRRERLHELRSTLLQRGVVPAGFVVIGRRRVRRGAHAIELPRPRAAASAAAER